MGSSVGLAAVKANLIADKIKEDQEKQGSLKNRIKYGAKHCINYHKAAIKDTFTTTAGVAASVGAAAAVAKSKTAQNFIMTGLKAVKNSNFVKDAVTTLKPLANKVAPYLTKAATWAVNLPTPAKAVLAAGVAITGIASAVIRNNYLVETGKIMKEQEVSAKLEKQKDNKAKELLG